MVERTMAICPSRGNLGAWRGACSLTRDDRGAVTDREGTAPWAVWLAWATVVSVVPSVIWRAAVGLGVDLGWSQQHLDLEQIPGYGTSYVITLSALSLLAASFTLGLVRPWGERLPRWLPIVGGRPVPVLMAVVASVVGASIVITICVMSIAHWNQVSGFADRPDSGWARLMAACYLPALLWGPMLLAVTWDYWRRRRTESGTRPSRPVRHGTGER